MAQQPTEQKTFQQRLKQSIDKFKGLTDENARSFKQKLEAKINDKVEQKLKDIKAKNAGAVQPAVDPERAAKQKLLSSLPEPLKSILEKKELSLDELTKLVSKIMEIIGRKQRKANKEGEEQVLEEDIAEIIQGYQALERIIKRNEQASKESKESQEETQKPIDDFIAVSRIEDNPLDANIPEDVIPMLLELSDRQNVTLDNLADELEEKIKTLDLDENCPESLKLEVREHVLKILGKGLLFEGNSPEITTLNKFRELQSSPEFQMMTDQQKHMAWAQTFEEIIKGLSEEQRVALFSEFNQAEWQNVIYQDINSNRLSDQKILEHFTSRQKPVTMNHLPAIKQTANFFGDYMRISQQMLAQRPLKSMYSELEQQELTKLSREDKIKYEKYLELKKSAEKLAIPECMKTAARSLESSQGSVSGFKDTNLERLSQLNLAQAELKDLDIVLSDANIITLLKSIEGGEQYCRDRQLLSKALASKLFNQDEKAMFKALFNQNHASFLQAYAKEKSRLVGVINQKVISAEDVSYYQQLHPADCRTVKELSSLEQEMKTQPFEKIVSVRERVQGLTEVSTDLKNTYDSVVILGNLKPVDITESSDTDQAIGGTVTNAPKQSYQIPLTGGGIKLRDDTRDTTFEIKKLSPTQIYFGREDDSQMSPEEKNKLFISLSENILANYTPGKSITLNVKNTDDALAFYYSMKKMSENFQTIDKEKGYENFSDFSMDNVKVSVNGRLMKTSELKNLVDKHESRFNPLGNVPRLKTIEDEIKKSLEKHSYRELAEMRFKDEYSRFASELQKKKNDHQEVNKDTAATVFQDMKEKHKLHYLTKANVERLTIKHTDNESNEAKETDVKRNSP